MTDLDLALKYFHQTGAEFGGGLTNHGPMVAEALHSLGHDALIDAWVEVYRSRLRERLDGRPIPSQFHERALGESSTEDWTATFELESETFSWRELLRYWLPRLLPGFFAAAAHGPIRVAHAIRALEEEETPTRLKELQIGLGYWASRFARFPSPPDEAPPPARGPAEILAELSLVPISRRRNGLLSDALGILAGEPEFFYSLRGLDLRGTPPEISLSELCAAAAGLYLANPGVRIAYVHAVTGPAALRLMAPYLDEKQFRIGVFFALQTAAALHVTNAQADVGGSSEDRPPAIAESWEEMRYLAACSAEEHVIKLTEACWREDRLRPDPRFRLAAADAIENLGRFRGGRGG